MTMNDRLMKAAVRLLEGTSTRATFHRGLKVDWFKAWEQPLGDALATLPELPSCSHELLAILAANPTRAEKRHALVSRRGQPVAVVSLRRRKDFWEPVTEHCVPSWDLFPTAPAESHGDVTRALGLEVRVGGYDADPTPLRPHHSIPYVTYQADLRGNFEGHWRDADRMNSIKQARKRTAGYQVRADHAGDAEWNADTWFEMWKDDPEEQYLAAEDRRRVWPTLVKQGKLHTVVLVDGDHPVAGAVFFTTERGLLFVCTARDKSRGSQAVGTRVLDASFHWASEAGFQELDLGGGGDYKRWWAPIGRNKYHVTFRPPLVDAAHRAFRLLRTAKDKLAQLQSRQTQ